MPKRKVRDSLVPPEAEAKALAAIREAFKHPHYLTPDEEREFLERRAHGAIERHEYIVTTRRGKRVYREHGKAGADLPAPPYYMEMLKRQRDLEAKCSKVNRGLAMRLRNQAGLPRPAVSAKHAEIAAELKVAAAVPGHIKRIATKLGVSVRTVQRVQREMRQNRK